MKATSQKFAYTGDESVRNVSSYEEQACKFMTTIGPERVIGVTVHRSSTECSATVWYWDNSTVKK